MLSIALIPARGGSKRVKNKNIRMLGDHPLMAWTITTAQQAGLPVWVSTDSPVIRSVALDYGANVIDRPPELAEDGVEDFDVIRHALGQVPADLVVYLRPTTPFRTADRIREAVRLMEVPGYDSLRSVEEMSESAWKCFVVRGQLLRPLMPGIDLTDRPNQALERTFHPNGYVDIARREIVDCGANLWGNGRYAFVTPRTIEIDTEEDFEYAEWWCHRHR